MVYSQDSQDKPVCVDSAFINQIKPGESGYYIEYPDGHAVFMEARTFGRRCPVHHIDDGMSFSAALQLAKMGVPVTRRGWVIRDVHMVVLPRAEGIGSEYIMYLKDNFAPERLRVWTPGQSDMFTNDWCVYEEIKS